MRRAFVEPLEWLEDTIDIRRVDDRAGVDDCELAASRDGPGVDPDLAGGEVVPDCVFDEV
jgi:hypothetical protein